MPLLSEKIITILRGATLEARMVTLQQYDLHSEITRAAIKLRQALIGLNDNPKKAKRLIKIIQECMRVLGGSPDAMVPVVCNNIAYQLALLWLSVIEQIEAGDLLLFADTVVGEAIAATVGADKARFLESMKSTLEDRLAVYEWVEDCAAVEASPLCAKRRAWFAGLMANIDDVHQSLDPDNKIHFAESLYDKYKTFVANGFFLVQSWPVMLVSDAALRARRPSIKLFYSNFTCKSPLVIAGMIEQEQVMNQLLTEIGLPTIHLVELYVREEVAAQAALPAEKVEAFGETLKRFERKVQRYNDDFSDLAADDAQVGSEAGGGGGGAAAAVPTRSGSTVKGRSSSKKQILQDWVNSIVKIGKTDPLSARIAASIQLANEALVALNELVDRRGSLLRMHKCLRSGQAEQLMISFLEVAINHLRTACCHYDRSLLSKFGAQEPVEAAQAGGAAGEDVVPEASPADQAAIQHIKDKLEADYGNAPLKAVAAEVEDHMPEPRVGASALGAAALRAPIAKVPDGSGPSKVDIGTPDFR